jgi:hypothetical protein
MRVAEANAVLEDELGGGMECMAQNYGTEFFS